MSDASIWSRAETNSHYAESAVAGDYYSELGVGRDASVDDVKKAYRKLAAKHHPDRNQGDASAEEKFKTVTRAHEVLADTEKRALYDEFGEEGLRAGFDPDAARAFRHGTGRVRSGGVNFEDLFRGGGGAGGGGGGGIGDMFGDLFGGGRGRGRREQQRGADLASQVTVDFADAIKGATLKLVLQDGGEPVTVRVPMGAKNGDRVRVRGHGAPGPSGVQGDLVLTVVVRPHPYFERDELDLYLDLPITVGEAYFGGKVPVPTPGGIVTLTVPASARSGQVMRLRGRGVERQGNKGDLFVRFLVRLPEEESDEIEAAVNTLQEHTKENPRSGLYF